MAPGCIPRLGMVWWLAIWPLFRFTAIHCWPLLHTPPCYSARAKSTGGGTMGSLPQLTQSSNPSLTASRLRRLLEDAVDGVPADGILLSAGLDNSIVSAISGKQARWLRAVYVTVEGAV